MSALATTRPDCDRLAPYYHLLETIAFGPTFQNARCAFLPEVASARYALLCGDGDGRFLARLLQTNPQVTVDFVDLSARMIQLAQQRAAALGPTHLERVQFFRQDVTEFVPTSSGTYDLVATHFFLDCFAQEEISQIVSRIVGGPHHRQNGWSPTFATRQIAPSAASGPARQSVPSTPSSTEPPV